jgi:outer membrane protein
MASPQGDATPPSAPATATIPPPLPAGPLSPETPGNPPAPPVLVLSIDEAVQTALRRNPTLEDASASIRRAQAVVQEARAFMRPRLDAQTGLTIQGPIPTFAITQPPTVPGGQARTQEVAFGQTFSRNLSVSGTFDPDPFGRLRANRRIAERSVNVARGSLFVTQNELVFSVQNVYLTALRARELIAVAQEAIEAAREQLRVAEAQFRAGTAPEFDVLRASVQVANLRQSLVTADATYRRTLVSLAELLSLEPQTRVELVPLALPPEPDAVAAVATRRVLEPDGAPASGPAETAASGGLVPQSVETALAEAYSRRPEVYRAEWTRRVAEAQLSLQRKGLTPSVNLGVHFLYTPDQTGFAVETKTWSIVANLAIPIWDAGLTRARVRQARAGVQSASAQAQSARDAVTEEVKRTLIDLEEAADRRRAAAANTVQAREALRIARVRYTAGLAPNVEVTDAEAALTQARSNEVNAAYDYLAALANLNRSLGRYAGDTLAMLVRK